MIEKRDEMLTNIIIFVCLGLIISNIINKSIKSKQGDEKQRQVSVEQDYFDDHDGDDIHSEKDHIYEWDPSEYDTFIDEEDQTKDLWKK